MTGNLVQGMIEELAREMHERLVDNPFHAPAKKGEFENPDWRMVLLFDKHAENATTLGWELAELAIIKTCGLIDRIVAEERAQEETKEIA
jgi:hypothetical protein